MSALLKFGCVAALFAAVAWVVFLYVALSNYNASTGDAPGSGIAFIPAGTIMIIGLYFGAVTAGWRPLPARGPSVALLVLLFGVPLLSVQLAGFWAPKAPAPPPESCALTLANTNGPEVELDVDGDIGSCQRVRDMVGAVGDGGTWNIGDLTPGRTPPYSAIPCGGQITQANLHVVVFQIAGDYALGKAICQQLGFSIG